jgi:hypothetical protein
MSISAATFKCDRDGIEAAGTVPGPAVPEGWASLNVFGPGQAPFVGHLCPACTEGLVAFLNASGGTFSLSPPAPQMPASAATATPAAPLAPAQP